MTHWANDAVFYHIYPLGLCDAPRQNDFTAPPQPRLAQLAQWIEHLNALGMTAIYLGPVFESSKHGYDTADYYRVDRRLGDDATLRDMVAQMHAHGIRVILDGGFHHVGRDFWAFRDLIQQGERSAYVTWFSGIDFTRRSPYGDPFAYDGWSGHYSLVKLNLHNPDVRAHLFGAVQHWVEQFGIDGLRLDVADALDLDFQRDLASFCRALDPAFWLMGEVVHGDYRRWANPAILDSVTNYECYKALYSSHNEHNYHEMAYALNRQFGEQGLYRGIPLYAFADNHDVSRVASILHNPAHLYPLYALLFTMPGVPSVYAGSEWGLPGRKEGHDDWVLRPPLRLPEAIERAPYPDLAAAIARFAHLRRHSVALRHGDYKQLYVAQEQFAFARSVAAETDVVALNAASSAASLDFAVPMAGGTFVDMLEPERHFTVRNGRLLIDSLSACSARILVLAA